MIGPLRGTEHRPRHRADGFAARLGVPETASVPHTTQKMYSSFRRAPAAAAARGDGRRPSSTFGAGARGVDWAQHVAGIGDTTAGQPHAEGPLYSSFKAAAPLRHKNSKGQIRSTFGSGERGAPENGFHPRHQGMSAIAPGDYKPQSDFDVASRTHNAFAKLQAAHKQDPRNVSFAESLASVTPRCVGGDGGGGRPRSRTPSVSSRRRGSCPSLSIGGGGASPVPAQTGGRARSRSADPPPRGGSLAASVNTASDAPSSARRPSAAASSTASPVPPRAARAARSVVEWVCDLRGSGEMEAYTHRDGADIERLWRRQRGGGASPPTQLSFSSSVYVFDFDAMTQTNAQTGKERKIGRRRRDAVAMP